MKRMAYIFTFLFLTGVVHSAGINLEIQSDNGAETARVFDDRGNHIVPFKLSIGSGTPVSLYSILGDYSEINSSTNTFASKRWFRYVVIQNTTPYVVEIGTSPNFHTGAGEYNLFLTTSSLELFNKADIYLKYQAGASSGSLRGRFERD